MKLFITGGDGYIGTYLVSSLLKKQINLRLLLHGSNIAALNNSNFIEPIYGDIRDKELLIKSVASVDAVIHLGAIVGSYNITDNMEINYEGTKNLLAACEINNIERFIFVSSVSAKRTAQGPYGKSKILAEKAVTDSYLNYTIFRPTTVMGRESLGLNRIIKNVNRFNYFIPMVGLGNYTRHPVYIMDFIDLINKSINNPISYNKVYEVGGEKVIRFRDLVKLVNSKLENRNKPIIPIPKQFISGIAFFLERMFDTPPFTREHVNALGENTSMNTTAIKEDLNFHPIPIDKMLDIILEEIKKNPPDIELT